MNVYSYSKVDAVKFEIPRVRTGINKDFTFPMSLQRDRRIFNKVPWDKSDFATDVAEKRKPDESLCYFVIGKPPRGDSSGKKISPQLFYRIESARMRGQRHGKCFFKFSQRLSRPHICYFAFFIYAQFRKVH